MSKWIVAAAAVVLVSGASMASAAEPAGKVSNSQLNALGLGGLTPISDAEGHQVRGKFLPSLDGLFGSGFGGIRIFSPGDNNFTSNTTNINVEDVNVEGNDNFLNFGGSGVLGFGGGNEFGPGSFGGILGGFFQQ
jgi:hypothetical protein